MCSLDKSSTCFTAGGPEEQRYISYYFVLWNWCPFDDCAYPQSIEPTNADSKDEKESEIEKLKSELNKFETLIEENRSSYEEILDKTAKSIEKFIENAETDQEKNVQ